MMLNLAIETAIKKGIAAARSNITGGKNLSRKETSSFFIFNHWHAFVIRCKNHPHIKADDSMIDNNESDSVDGL